MGEWAGNGTRTPILLGSVPGPAVIKGDESLIAV